MIASVVGLTALSEEVVAQPRAMDRKAPLDIALRWGDVPRERLPVDGYRAEIRPDPWEDLEGIGYDLDDTGVPQRRAPGTLPIDIGGLGGLLDGETIPLFRWRVTPPS